MKKIIFIILTAVFLVISNLNAQTSTKTLIVYFSWGGNTKTAANIIKNMMKADIFEIKTIKEYPTDINVCGNQARNELINNILPDLKENINNISNYDNIIICYPNWWNTIPQAVKQLLLTHNFSGKKIAPLCTYGLTTRLSRPPACLPKRKVFS